MILAGQSHLVCHEQYKKKENNVNQKKSDHPRKDKAIVKEKKINE
jgi:hypothetical protein